MNSVDKSSGMEEFINFHHVPELSTSGAFVQECQRCGALVYDRHSTKYEWQRINNGARRHLNWHESQRSEHTYE